MSTVRVIISVAEAIPAANVSDSVERFFVVRYTEDGQHINLTLGTRFLHFVEADICPAFARPYNDYADRSHL